MPGEKIGIQAMKRSLIKTWLWASICLALLVPRLRCPFFQYNFWCFDWQTQVKAWQWGASRLEPQHYQYTEDIQDDYIKHRHINIIIYICIHFIQLYHQANAFKLVKESPDPCSMQIHANRAIFGVQAMSCEESFLQFIREKGRITGKLHLVLRDGRHFLESEDPQLLRHLCDQDGWRGVIEAYLCTVGIWGNLKDTT